MNCQRCNWSYASAFSLFLISLAAFAPGAYGQTAAQSRPRLANETQPAPAAEAVLTLNQAFFDMVLETVLRDFAPPSYPLKLAALDRSGALTNDRQTAHALLECPNAVTLAREVGNVRTQIFLREGQLTAPLAFTGSYKPVLGCLRFQGWAETEMNLDFNAAQQTLNLRVTVKNVHLNGVPSLFTGPLKGMVQDSLDQRINPLPLLRAEQLSAQVPLQALGGTLQLRAREVRPVISDGALSLHILYDFARAN